MNRPIDDTSLTGEQLRQLDELPDEPDTSDIPETPSEAWANAVFGPFHMEGKKNVRVWLDPDIFRWMISKGRGYPDEINAILRREMEAEKAAK